MLKNKIKKKKKIELLDGEVEKKNSIKNDLFYFIFMKLR